MSARHKPVGRDLHDLVRSVGPIAKRVLSDRQGPATRDELSFTRRNEVGRLENWVVDKSTDWNASVVRGGELFRECVELARADETAAFEAIKAALVQWSGGRGVEFGFSDELARAVLDGLRARRAGARPFTPEVTA
jgi:hypothetical protein